MRNGIGKKRDHIDYKILDSFIEEHRITGAIGVGGGINTNIVKDMPKEGN